MENAASVRPRAALIMAIVAVIFGGLTLKSGATVLFIDGADRAAAGNYVPFVLWFNYLAGFAYVLAGLGLYLWRGWAYKVSLLIAGATMLVFAALGVYILMDGIYEMRTVGAMTLRCVVWLTIGLVSRRAWNSQLVRT